MGVMDFMKGGGSGPNVGPQGSSLPEELMWLADAPLFIDDLRVDAFYDAIFRPDYGETSLTLQKKVNKNTKLGGEATLGSLFPGLFAKVGVTVSGEHSRGREDGQERALQPISSAYRHLLALALHYSTENQARLVLARTPNQDTGETAKATDGDDSDLPSDWLLSSSNFIRALPRAMILLDLEAGCKLIPAAVELSNGDVKLLYKDLEAGFGGTAPQYPGARSTLVERNAYWQWFAENYKDRVALDAVEDAVAGQKIQWIAYRVSLGDDTGPFLHLSLAAHGAYETGVFGYNFISRGTKHGLRLVGTLKSEPDMDVLAVFER